MKFAAAIIIKDKKVLLLKRAEIEDQGKKWCPPNETIEKGETPKEAVVRGVKEEVNLTFKIDKIFPEKTHSYNGLKTAVFLGQAKGTIKLEPKEASEFGWFTYEEAIKLDFAYGYEKLIEKLHKLNII